MRLGVRSMAASPAGSGVCLGPEIRIRPKPRQREVDVPTALYNCGLKMLPPLLPSCLLAFLPSSCSSFAIREASFRHSLPYLSSPLAFRPCVVVNGPHFILTLLKSLVDSRVATSKYCTFKSQANSATPKRPRGLGDAPAKALDSVLQLFCDYYLPKAASHGWRTVREGRGPIASNIKPW
jgi:hypothetical protein